MLWTVRARCETCKYDLKLLSPLIISILLAIIPILSIYWYFNTILSFDSVYSLLISLIIAFLLEIVYLFDSINLINEQKLNKKNIVFSQMSGKREHMSFSDYSFQLEVYH